MRRATCVRGFAKIRNPLHNVGYEVGDPARFRPTSRDTGPAA